MAEQTDILSRLRAGADGRFWLRFAGAATVSSVLLAGLVWLAEPAEIWSVVVEATLAPLIAAAGLYALVLGARWIRLVG
ncbi:MAG: hypothetical protein ABEN55_02400, partial [Bradymonadaceae bacterium]